MGGDDSKTGSKEKSEEVVNVPTGPLEVPVPAPNADGAAGAQSVALQPAQVCSVGPFRSVQVNIDAQGNNIIPDAANEPSLEIDPTNPQRIVVGWRQFDTFRTTFVRRRRLQSDGLT